MTLWVKLDKKTTETFGEDMMSRRLCFEWYLCFKSGQLKMILEWKALVDDDHVYQVGAPCSNIITCNFWNATVRTWGGSTPKFGERTPVITTMLQRIQISLSRDFCALNSTRVTRPKVQRFDSGIAFAFELCFPQWTRRWGKCVQQVGEYIRGDQIE